MESNEVINSDKEFLNWIYERMICVHGEKDMYDYMINFKSVIDRIETASGSVAAPKEDAEIIEELEAKGVRSLLRENTDLREALKELLPIAERKFNATSHREYIALKAIIDRARKFLSK